MVTWSENIVTSTQHICKMYFSVPKAKFFLFFFFPVRIYLNALLEHVCLKHYLQ